MLSAFFNCSCNAQKAYNTIPKIKSIEIIYVTFTSWYFAGLECDKFDTINNDYIVLSNRHEIEMFIKTFFESQRDTIVPVWKSLDTRAKIIFRYENGYSYEICCSGDLFYFLDDIYIKMKDYKFYNLLTYTIKKRDPNFGYYDWETRK
jgi:hypothetical protein